MSRQAAWEWYKRKSALQERYRDDLRDAQRAAVAVDDSAPDSATY
jgi:hypothetical protein